jgi:hypothetical protein
MAGKVWLRQLADAAGHPMVGSISGAPFIDEQV